MIIKKKFMDVLTQAYAHAIRSADEAAAETLEDILTAPTSNRKNKRG